ncbi:MAG: hypothetical protein K2O31_07550, partial [Clostridia bacterium]|nr:hypothetical protein [Clostridia bacterium]
ENIQGLPNNIRVVINDFDETESGSLFTQITDIYDEEIKAYNFKSSSIFVIQSYKNTDIAKGNLKMIKLASEKIFGTDKFVFQANERQDGSYEIPKHVWNSIDSCDCIICDITPDRFYQCNGKNFQGVSENVWLELGYAISKIRSRKLDLGKRLIVIGNEDFIGNNFVLPTDLREINIYPYKGQSSLYEKIHEILSKMYLS